MLFSYICSFLVCASLSLIGELLNYWFCIDGRYLDGEIAIRSGYILSQVILFYLFVLQSQKAAKNEEKIRKLQQTIERQREEQGSDKNGYK